MTEGKGDIAVAPGFVSAHRHLDRVLHRQQVAEYYQDLLDIVGLDSSEGRLTAFVERRLLRPARQQLS